MALHVTSLRATARVPQGPQPLPSQIEPLGSLGIRCPASVVATSDYIFVIRGMFAALRRTAFVWMGFRGWGAAREQSGRI
jgi:hypothetical protein